MKQILLLFFILLLSVSVDEIKKDSKLDVIIKSEDMNDFLANVAFWLNHDNDEFKKAYKESAEQDASLSFAQDSGLTPQVEVTEEKMSEQSANQALENKSVLLALNSENQQNNEDKKNPVIGEEGKESPITENKVSATSAEVEKMLVENTSIETSTPTLEIDSEKSESVSLSDEVAPEIPLEPMAETVKIDTETPVEILNKKKYLDDISYEDINLDKVLIVNRPNSYKVDFTLINLGENQQRGIIEFSMEFEDGTVIPFSSIRGSYRFRHQVAKKYVVTKGEDIKKYSKISEPYAFVVGFLHEGVLIKRNKFLLSK